MYYTFLSRLFIKHILQLQFTFNQLKYTTKYKINFNTIHSYSTDGHKSNPKLPPSGAKTN